MSRFARNKGRRGVARNIIALSYPIDCWLLPTACNPNDVPWLCYRSCSCSCSCFVLFLSFFALFVPLLLSFPPCSCCSCSSFQSCLALLLCMVMSSQAAECLSCLVWIAIMTDIGMRIPHPSEQISFVPVTKPACDRYGWLVPPLLSHPILVPQVLQWRCDRNYQRHRKCRMPTVKR